MIISASQTEVHLSHLGCTNSVTRPKLHPHAMPKCPSNGMRECIGDYPLPDRAAAHAAARSHAGRLTHANQSAPFNWRCLCCQQRRRIVIAVCREPRQTPRCSSAGTAAATPPPPTAPTTVCVCQSVNHQSGDTRAPRTALDSAVSAVLILPSARVKPRASQTHPATHSGSVGARPHRRQIAGDERVATARAYAGDYAAAR